MPYKEERKWRGKVTFQGQRYTALRETKRKALEWESGKRKELKEMNQIVTGMDMLTFCNKYTDFFEKHLSKKTIQEKKAVCKRVLVEWRNIPVEDITPSMVLEYLHKQSDERSANAYNKDRTNLMAMFGYGVNFLGLTHNPLLGIPKMKHDREPQYVPPTEHVLRVLAAATREEKVLLDCYLNTGARRSEIFRWTWHEDINFEKRTVRLGTRKTRDGSMEYEWVPMNEELYASLCWWWNHRPVKNTPYIFVRTQPGPWYGKPYTQRRRFMRGLCKRAKVKSFGFHALRRFVASYLADVEKVSTKKIQRILRHKSIHTTERYIRNLNNDLRETYSLLSGFQKKRHEEEAREEQRANQKIG